jgi:hypothetical protein
VEETPDRKFTIGELMSLVAVLGVVLAMFTPALRSLERADVPALLTFVLLPAATFALIQYFRLFR